MVGVRVGFVGSYLTKSGDLNFSPGEVILVFVGRVLGGGDVFRVQLRGLRVDWRGRGLARYRGAEVPWHAFAVVSAFFCCGSTATTYHKSFEHSI